MKLIHRLAFRLLPLCDEHCPKSAKMIARLFAVRLVANMLRRRGVRREFNREQCTNFIRDEGIANVQDAVRVGRVLGGEAIAKLVKPNHILGLLRVGS